MTKNESVEQMEQIKIYLHEKDKFNFFLEQDIMPNSFKIEPPSLQREHTTTFTLRQTPHNYYTHNISNSVPYNSGLLI